MPRSRTSRGRLSGRIPAGALPGAAFGSSDRGDVRCLRDPPGTASPAPPPPAATGEWGFPRRCRTPFRSAPPRVGRRWRCCRSACRWSPRRAATSSRTSGRSWRATRGSRAANRRGAARPSRPALPLPSLPRFALSAPFPTSAVHRTAKAALPSGRRFHAGREGAPTGAAAALRFRVPPLFACRRRPCPHRVHGFASAPPRRPPSSASASPSGWRPRRSAWRSSAASCATAERPPRDPPPAGRPGCVKGARVTAAMSCGCAQPGGAAGPHRCQEAAVPRRPPPSTRGSRRGAADGPHPALLERKREKKANEAPRGAPPTPALLDAGGQWDPAVGLSTCPPSPPMPHRKDEPGIE